MNQALSTYVPLYGFMLLPVWIPVFSVSIGWLLDRFGGKDVDSVAARVAAAKEQTRAGHVADHPVALPEAA
ncbi:hypothetical protein [Nocardioides sp. MH1]|uniref:hypothetical protein n=1 Tax=Nocardioides sp. MH1 TaxID=3242490 RepID=UPI0035211D52